MRVKIGTYTKWGGPYQLAELLCFWAKPVEDEHGFKSKPQWVHNFGEWLAHGSVEPDEKVGDITSWDRERHDTLLSKFLTWIHSKQKRTVKVHIDRWDTWSMDHTLAPIILPMLVQLKANKHGAPIVDDEDVPKELKSTSAEPKEKDWDTDSNHFKRWDWVMDEMIWAFEQKCRDDWQDDYYGDYVEDQKNGPMAGSFEWIDRDGMNAHQKRMSNGFKLFGKYFENLWT
jgi:hypothetical protein